MSNSVAGRRSAVRPDSRDPGASQIARYLFQVEEAERRRIARELHDETAQGLTVVRFYLGVLQDISANRSAQKTLGEALAVIDRTIEGLRRIVARLSPQVLEKLGLIAGIRKEARTLSRSGNTQVDVKISPRFGRLPPETELALYRLVQEALHNIAKHAQAKHVQIDLRRDGGNVHLLIADDGVGFGGRANAHRNSYGLFGMRERIRSLGGTFRIRSQRGRGTRISLSISRPPAPVPQPIALSRLLPIRDDGQKRASGA